MKMVMTTSITNAPVATIAVLGFVLSTFPAAAQTAGGYRQYCQTINGHVVCGQAAGSPGVPGARPYEVWENGSPARAPSSPYRYPAPDAPAFPQSFGSYNNLCGFGR
jgi:hypothetical protein